MRFNRFAAAALLAVPALAAAQDAAEHTLSVGVLAGGTFPTGRLSRQLYDPGYQIGALAQAWTPLRWLGVRVDGSYRRTSLGRQQIVDQQGIPHGTVSVDVSFRTLAASVVARAPGLRSPLQPYALAGYGTYGLRGEVTHSDDPTLAPNGRGDFRYVHGAHVGLGVDAPVGRARAFVETRYEHVGPSLRFMPVDVGVRLR